MMEKFELNYKKGAAALAVLLVIFGVAYLAVITRNALKAYNYIGVSEEQKHYIAVDGEGRVVGTPDIAKVQIGQVSEKKTVAEAQKENTDKMNALIKKLKDDFKIEEKDIQTANYNVYPLYDYVNNRQTIRGYQVSQNVNIKIRDLSKINSVLELVGSLGLNQVGSLTFEIDDPEALKSQAREKAILAAKAKAEALANITGVKLGKIISFSETSSGMTSPMYSMDKVAYGMGGGSAAPEIQAGSSEVVIMATIEYEIK